MASVNFIEKDFVDDQTFAKLPENRLLFIK